MEPQDSPIDATAALEHLDWVRGLARSLVRDASLADDITQEACLAALQRPAAAGGASKGWLARVVRNAVRQENRRNAIRREHEERTIVRDETAPTDEVVERVHTQRLVVDAVLALDDPYQRVILLRYFEGLTPRAIARRQGIPVATVKTRLRRGLAQLRQALDGQHGGDRAAWTPAVAALGTPAGSSAAVGSGMGTGTLLMGGLVVGTMMKVSAAVLVAAAGVYFLAGGSRTESASPESPEVIAIDPLRADSGLADPESLSTAEGPSATEVGRRSLVAQEPPADGSLAIEARVLRVVLEGVSEEYARGATVTVAGVEEGGRWHARIHDSWPALGSTSEFDLHPFFERMAQRGKLRDEELVVAVDHPLHFSETIQLPLASGVERDGQTVYEARVRLAEVVYWPELALSVRDANSRAHLQDVELRCVPTAYMGLVQQPGASDPFTVIGAGLSSPIVMRGGRKTGAPEDMAAGMALVSTTGEALQPAELTQPEENARGIMVYARAPGYAWSRLVIDVSKGSERELLLEPGAALSVRLANVQPERYAELEKRATAFVRKIQPDGSEATVWSRELDSWIEAEATRIEALEPGDYAVLVELSSSWRRKPMEIGRETISIPAGEVREVLLVVPDPPEPLAHASLGGVVSFPSFGGEEDVRMEFYRSDYRYGDPDFVLSSSEMKPVSAALPTWSFQVDDLPVGLYQLRLLPFLKSWMIELPDGGRDDVELVIPELAEVLVETVDARTGQSVPYETIVFRTLEVLPDQVTHGGSGPWLSVEYEGEPGRFRFWAAPGEVGVRASGQPTDVEYSNYAKETELTPGRHSIRLELNPTCILRFEFRVDGAALPHEDAVFVGLSKGIRAVGHDGRAGGMYPYSLVEASAPGLYEISFEGVGADRFLPIPPRRVEVREGETTEVIVELQRR